MIGHACYFEANGIEINIRAGGKQAEPIRLVVVLKVRFSLACIAMYGVRRLPRIDIIAFAFLIDTVWSDPIERIITQANRRWIAINNPLTPRANCDEIAFSVIVAI